MEPIEVKTTGELIDDLITTNIKIWHLVDRGHGGDGQAAIQSQHVNQRRSKLIRAINRRLGGDGVQITRKVFTGEG